jgi:hypothetical protein
MLLETLNHLLNNVLPAARDYECAGHDLSAAFARNADPQSWISHRAGYIDRVCARREAQSTHGARKQDSGVLAI